MDNAYCFGADSLKLTAAKLAKVVKCSESMWKLLYYATVQACVLTIIYHGAWSSDTKEYFRGCVNQELELGISPVHGVLLHGSPGCSKTILTKAAAHAAQASFFYLSAAKLYSLYVGEGETVLLSTFQRPRLAAPRSIIFFDEAGVVAAKRSCSSSNNVGVGERILSTLLTELDGLEQAKGILVLAATNHPRAIDATLVRPGHFGLVIYVPPPDSEADRCSLSCCRTRKMDKTNHIDDKKLEVSPYVRYPWLREFQQKNFQQRNQKFESTSSMVINWMEKLKSSLGSESEQEAKHFANAKSEHKSEIDRHVNDLLAFMVRDHESSHQSEEALFEGPTIFRYLSSVLVILVLIVVFYLDFVV